MGYGSKCRIWYVQVEYIENSDKWLISLDHVTYVPNLNIFKMAGKDKYNSQGNHDWLLNWYKKLTKSSKKTIWALNTWNLSFKGFFDIRGGEYNDFSK